MNTKTIHQMHRLPEEQLPPLLKRTQATVRASCTETTGWSYKFWTDVELEALMIEEYAGLLPIFKQCRTGVQRGDLGRLLVLHKFGGLYLDLDIELLRNPNTIFEYADSKKLILAPEPVEQVEFLKYSQNSHLKYLCNAFIYAEKGLPIVKRLLDIVEGMFKTYGPNIFNQFDVFGGRMLTTVYHYHGQRAAFSLLESDLVYPINDLKLKELPNYERDIAFLRDRDNNNVTEPPIALHYWVHGDFEGSNSLPTFQVDEKVALSLDYLRFFGLNV